MANIRSYKDFRFTQIDGSVSINQGFTNKWVKGIHIYFDDKSIVNKPIHRYICGQCGHVFDEANGENCPNCGNSQWQNIHIGGRYYYRGRWGTDGKCNHTIPELINDLLVTPMISVEWDKGSNRFDIKESYYDLVSITSEGFLHVNATANSIDYNLLDKLFYQWIEDDPKWDSVKVMENIYPCETIRSRFNIEENDIFTMFRFYNLMKSIPNLSTLSPDMFYAVWDRMSTASCKIYKSLTDFYKDVKIPLAFVDIYSITGLPTEGMDKIDNLDPIVLKAMSYSLVHRHTTFRDISYMIRSNDDVDKINNNPAEFAEFFRKNVIKFASDTLNAFEYVDGNATIKDANIKKFINYCGKKNIKRDKIENFYNSMYEGDAIKALRSLL